MSNSSDLDKRLTLWEGASTARTPQYPQGTPKSKPHHPRFPIIRDPDTDPVPKPLGPRNLDRRKLALERITHPQYRNQSMREFHPVPRETPKTHKEWYAPELSPSDCVYSVKKRSKTSTCTVTHTPTSLSTTCTVRGSTRYALKKAEFRLAQLIKLRQVEIAAEECDVIWMHEVRDRINERRRRVLTDSW